MRVTIFGASGLLGKALMREWSGDAVIGLGSRDLVSRSLESRVERSSDRNTDAPPPAASISGETLRHF